MRDLNLRTLCHTRSCAAEAVWKNTCDCRRSQRCNTFTGLLLVPRRRASGLVQAHPARGPQSH